MINNIEFLAFLRENLSLARTIVIKNENLALSDNALMKAHYGLDSGNDKSKWRYYLNLNGEYHVTDDMMQVKSLDDNELIDFTKENLEQHPATKKAYRLGGYYFSRLNAQYPHQADLIQGIINPIPPEESIAADNFQILRYTKEYVSWNETQLIPALQDDIYKNAYQFYDTEYMYTDNLMSPALIAVMEKCVFEFLLECRYENRKTRHAHPFYIWSYLQSRGISPIYKDLLNERQTMWMFRNIDYVLRNLGKEKTFEELIDILLTERNIPLSKYDLILSTEDMSDTLKPEPYYFSKRLNLIEKKGNGEGLHKISTVMLKENPESLDNELNYDQFLSKTREESSFGVQATYPIKILDSELVDTTNRKLETIYTVLNNELIYLAGNGLYNINLDIEEPRTGIHHRVTVKEAIVMWHHLLNKYNGADCDNIHKFYYQSALRITPPKLSELLDTGTKPFITPEWCKDVLKTYIPQIRIVSPSIFYQNALDIFNLKWDHQKMYSRWLSIGYVSRRKNAVSAMYETGFISLTDETSYSAFMEKFDINFEGYSKEDYFRLMWELWKKMTGWDQFTHITVGQIQSGMLGLMKFLSSYSVQYIYQTVMEEGWYEGGLDLFTENPSLLNHNESEGQPELEVNTLRWLPVHHRATTDHELEGYYFESGRFEYWDMITDMIEQGKIMQTPLLYDCDYDDGTGGDNVHDAYTVDMTNKLRNYCGSLPYNLEDLIPKGGSRASDHVLKEMIVDSFEGLVTVGPWTATDIVIVNNRFDNKGVANTVEGYDYGKIVHVENFTQDGVEMNRYYVGFVPALLNSQVIKLDVIAVNNDTGDTVHVRFDYNIVTKQNTWSISFEIPETVQIDSPFTVTPTITGLSLGTETIVEEAYVVDNDIAEYLTVGIEDGKVVGNFLKKGWPDELPVLYVLRTSNGDTDELLARHYYYMRGLIPADRYYDPIDDPMFEPSMTYNEADLYAMTLEHFTMAATNNGWEAADLYIKKNDDGSIPTDLVKTDYENIKDFLTPTLADIPYTDEVVDGVTMRTFMWKYAVADKKVSIPMILELRNAETGDIVYREFTYTPTVIDHDAKVTYTIYRSTEYKIPINRTREVSLGVEGFGDNVTILNGAGIPVGAEGNDTHVTFSYDSTGDLYANSVKVDGYVIKTVGMPEINSVWGIKVTAQTKATNGKMLMLYPYNIITLTPDQFADYDSFDKPNVKISAWGDYPLYTHAFAGTRFAVNELENAWKVASIDITKSIDSSLDAISTAIDDHLGNHVFTDLTPTVTLGVDKDGNESVPEGKESWFTIYALGNRTQLGEGENILTLPVYITFTNEVINDSKTLQMYVDLRIINKPISRATESKNPEKIKPGKENHIVPDWVGLPYTIYGDADETLNEGFFFGTNLYSGGTGYKDYPVCVWNEDHTADITMPGAPLTAGKGIRIFNKRTYRATSEELVGSSLQDVVYYPYIDYSKDEIELIDIPELSDFDFTNIPSSEFFKGVRSSYVTLYDPNKIYEMGWKITNVDLEVLGAENESDYIITTLNGVDIKSNAYKCGTQANAIHDAPAGKTKYSTSYASFVPAVEGKLTLGVLVTLAYTKNTSVEQKVYRYEIEIDVKPQEGVIAFDSAYPEPWWAVGHETYYLTTLSDISGSVSSKTILFAAINKEDSVYASVRAAVNSMLSSSRALAVNVTQSFSPYITPPRAVLGWRAFFNGYYSTDPRRTRIYFGTLDIKASNVYHVEDITIDTINFEPDVVFEKMAVNQSYTERFVYDSDVKGWSVNTMRLQEVTSWMNHVFEYDGATVKEYSLFNVGSQNVSKDKTVDAPEGKRFYLPLYGGRTVGKFPVTISILLTNSHHLNSTTIELSYKTEREIVKSNIKLNLGYDAIYIGKNNIFTGEFEGVPSEDMHYGLVVSEDRYAALGNKASSFQLTKYPYSIKVSEDYEEGSGNGLAIRTARLYGEMGGGLTMETATWIRGYRGEQIIEEKNIIDKIEYPTDIDFDLIPLPSVLIEGVACTLGYLYDTTVATDYKWTCADDGLAVYGTDRQSEVMIDTIGGKQFTDKYIYDYGTETTVPSDAPEYAANYRYGYVTFVPATAGSQVIEVNLALEHASGNIPTYIVTFEIDVEVLGAEGRVYYKDDVDPWFLIDKEVGVETVLTDYSGTLVSDTTTVTGVPSYYEDALSTVIRQNKLYVKALIDFEGLDRSYIAGHTVTVEGYDANDKRAVRTYYGIITVNNKHVYALDNLPPELIDLQGDIIFEEMEQFTSYTERYSYLRVPPSGWLVDTTRIVEEKDWMNHVIEYDGLTATNAQLFSSSNAKRTYDYNVNAPADRWFSTPTYGSRTLGDKEVTFEVSVYTTQFGSRITGKIYYKQIRKIIDADIGMDFSYSSLIIGEKNAVTANQRNIPRPDLKEGVIASNTYILKTGKMANYFTYGKSPTTLTIASGYTPGSNGIMLTFLYPYSSRRAGHKANSYTDNRAYRADVIIPDSDIAISPAMFEIVPAGNQLMTNAVCGERFYVKSASELAALGYKIESIGIKGVKDGTYDKSLIIGELEGFPLYTLYSESHSNKTDWSIDGKTKDAFIVSFMLQPFSGTTRTIPMVVRVSKGDETFEVPFNYEAKDIIAGTIPTVSLSYSNYNYWAVNEKEDKKTIMQVANVVGGYRKRNIGSLRPLGDNSSKTTSTITNSGAIGSGTANCIFRFNDVSDMDFRYTVQLNFLLSNVTDNVDTELQTRYFPTYLTIPADRVQDYDNWDFSIFNFEIGQYKPMYANEYSVLELKTLGYKDGLGIGNIELISFSNDVVTTEITVDGVTQQVPLPPNYIMNVDANGQIRASTNPECYLFLGFIPKYAADTTIRFSVTFRVGYSSYTVDKIFEFTFKTHDYRGHVGLIGDKYWTNTEEKVYQIATHRTPVEKRDNMALVNSQVGFFSTDKNTIYLSGADKLNIFPAPEALAKPLEIFIFYQYRDNNMVNKPARPHGIIHRYRFYNNGYEWKIKGSTTSKTGTRTSLYTEFELYKNGEKSQDSENAAVPPARQVIDGLSHAVSYGGGVVTNGVYTRSYLSSYIPETYFEAQAIGDTVVAGNSAHIFASFFDAAFYISKRLFCRSMYLNRAGNLVMEFAYNAGSFVGDWNTLPDKYELTKQKWQIGGSNNVAASMADMTLVSMDVKNVENVGIVTFELEKPASVAKIVYNSLLTIDSVLTVTFPDGSTADLQIRVEKGRMTW